MNLIIFSDSTIVKKSFGAVEKSKAVQLVFLSRENLRKDIKDLYKKDLIYIDISEYDQKQISSLLTFLSKQNNKSFGIIDPKNQVIDIAELFFQNITDYIGKLLLKENINLARIKKAFKFIENPDIEEIIPKKDDYIYSLDWKSIKPGNEYTFIFLYIGVAHKDKIKQRYNANTITKLQNNLRNYLANFLIPYNGKIWIWNNLSGLILFPFNGKDTEAVLSACRLFLNQKIISIECINVPTIISLKIAMQIGNTVYKKRGDTGNIISKTINSIFHLGQRFTKPETFSITKDVFVHLKNGLKDNFIHSGTFEGNEIYQFEI